MGSRASERSRLSAILSLVIDLASVRGDVCAAVEAAVRAGVDWVQVRDRALAGRALLAHADAVIGAARRGARGRDTPVRVLINRRVDVALASGADGVHLGFDAIDPRDARRLLGAAATIGHSAHAPEQIDPQAGLSYAQLAPIFAPLSKPLERPPLGLQALTRAAARGVPVLAQGGITLDNARAVRAAGAAGVAVTGAILLAPDPAEAARALREALDA
jgi:thiamine-phosphate pyrophosphorylase